MAIDKRILKTKTNIKNAYMQLTVDNEYEKITVSRIAEKANVNRSTFYLHYADAAAVAADIEKEIANKITKYLESFDMSDVYGSTYQIFKSLSVALGEDTLTSRYLMVLSQKSANIIEKIFVEKTVEAILKAYPYLTKGKLIYPVTFISAGIVSTYFRWTQTDKTYKTMDELIRELSAIINTIIKNLTKRE